MSGGFTLVNTPSMEAKSDTWVPVVKNKHGKVKVSWNEMTLALKEGAGDRRRMDFIVRCMTMVSLFVTNCMAQERLVIDR